MLRFYNDEFVKKVKQIEDEEIKIVLCLAAPDVKQYYYLIFNKSNDEEIGQCGLRLEENADNLYLGNVEYEIYEEYRGNNYAFKATKLLGEIALNLGANNLIITARPDNIPSIKTIEKLKARFVEIRKVPKHMRLYKTGNKIVSVYNWNLHSTNR